MIFIYLILLIVSVFFYILYEGVISLMLFASLLIMPVVMLLFNLYAVSRFRIKLSIDQNYCTAGQNIPVSIIISNASVIPIPCAEILLEYSVSSSRKSERLKINTPVFPGNTQKLASDFSCEHLGTVSCRIVRIRIYDMLRLTHIRVAAKNISQENTSVLVMPETIELSNPVSDYSYLGLESDIYSPDKPGDDPSEIFALREYADGDKMTRIHWKLTAKTDQMMVKDYSLPLADSFLILTDTYIPDGADNAEDIYDTMIELSVSISALLQSKEKRHRLACYNESADDLWEASVIDEQSMLDAAASLLHCGMARHADLTAAAALSDNPLRRYGHLLLVCASVSDDILSALSASGLANRYTALLCCPDKGLSADISNSDINIIIVEHGRIEQSINDLSL